MGTVITNLKARFGVDTSDFRKGLKDGEQSIDDFKGTAGGILDEFASAFGVNMGAVNSAIGTASKSLNFLGQGFKAAGKGGDVLAISMKLLKYAIVSTGIGAIVVLLGTLLAYFMKTGEGTDKFAKILMQVKSVVNNVIERLAVFGKGLWELMTGKFKQGWETMRGAFKGMGDEIKEDWKASGSLADRMDQLEDREIALINSLEERKTKVKELRLQAKEEIGDANKKLELLKEAEKLTKSVYADQISVERERLAIMKEKLAIQGKDPTDEQRREIAEQEAKINQLLGARADELKAITKEANSATAAVKKQEEAFGSTKNLKMPEFTNKNWASNLKNSMNEIKHTAIQTKEAMSSLYLAMDQVAVDAAGAINDAFSSLANGMGEFLGALMTGNAGMQDFGKMVIGVFADLAINVGKIAIGAGLAVLGIKQALMTLNPWVAIAAGVALVAIGTAVKGALSNASRGGAGASASSSGSGNFLYDTRSATKTQTVELTINGEFKAKGSELALVLNEETTRKKIVNGR